MKWINGVTGCVSVASLVLAASLVAGIGCSDPQDDQCADVSCVDGTSCNGQTGQCEVDAAQACTSGTRWSAGTRAFRDASADWGLDESGANGQRISVADINADGWADLSVRHVGSEPDDFSDGGTRRSWLLKNTGDASFEDVTRSSGLVTSRVDEDGELGRPVDVVIWGDVDNDGDIDAYTGFNEVASQADDGHSAEIMLNNGDGTFELGPADSAARHLQDPNSPGAASFVDIDRDGLLDLWVAQYQAGGRPLQDRLLMGQGGGQFRDVTDQAGLTTEPWQNLAAANQARSHTFGWGAAACDLNNDGTPELLSASYRRAPNHLFVGDRADDGTVTFTNASVSSGYAYDQQTDWTDNESARCFCQLHPDAQDCQGVESPEFIQCNSDADVFRWNHPTDRQLYRLGGLSNATICADVDNDRWIDLLNTENVHWDVGSSADPSELLYNEHDPAVRFERPGNEATGLTRQHHRIDWNDADFTSVVFDFDNDGRKDIYIGSTEYPGTRGHLWHQKTDKTFEVVPIDDGIDHKSSHGVAAADYDHDGDLDLVVGHSRSRCDVGDHCYPPEQAHVRLFENTVGQDGNWLQVDLEGADGTNRAAIGARVTVTTDTQVQVSDVDGGHGHYGMQNELTRHFGLGPACRATVTVRWPDAALSEQTFVLKAGHRYSWTQGQTPVVLEDQPQ